MKHYRQLEKELAAQEEKYLRLLAEKSELAYCLAAQSEEAAYIRKQESDVRSLHQSMRRLKHDMKNHLMVIASCLNSGDDASAKTYISKILDKLNAVHSYIETGNSILNHILNEKLNYARENGISIKAEIENLSFKKMESLDFSALLSNILDNAVRACADEEAPEICVIISKRREYETILVKNKISVSVLKENPELKTTHPDKASHGMGVPQIKAITEKYGGMCDFYEKDGYFCACAFVPV